MQNNFIERGGLWVVGQSILLLMAAALGVVFRGQWHSVAGFVIGWLLFGIGAVFGILGVRTLGSARTPYPRPLPEARLVRTGIYGIVRHPLYASLVYASFGWALIWQSGPALAAALALSLFLDAKARREERWLRERFPEYEEYQREVRRLVPGIY